MATEVVLHDFGRGVGAGPFATPIRDSAGNLYGTTSSGGPDYAGTIYKLDAAGNYTVLHTLSSGAGGRNPESGVIRDAAGNFYGTTTEGGTTTSYNAGVVYKLDASGQYTLLHVFTGGTDGAGPYAGVTLDAAGNLYGTTAGGGFRGCDDINPPTGCGVIFKVDAAGNYTVLHHFTGGSDGGRPYAGVILDPAGNLYGAASLGGTNECSVGCGIVYRVDTAGNFTTLYTFTSVGGSDPYGDLIRDEAGNLYGTTVWGGEGFGGFGVVYKIDPVGNETVLYRFRGKADGSNPYAGVVMDAAGNLYGTTTTSFGAAGDGVVFKLDPNGQESVLHSFEGADGNDPRAGVILDSAGNLYGATPEGGAENSGTVYTLDPAGHETVLLSFPTGALGDAPSSALSSDAIGNLYGTASQGGTGTHGVVYELDASHDETLLYSFTGGADGGSPYGGVVRDVADNFYGTTLSGGGTSECPTNIGSNGCGVVYKLDTTGQETVLYRFTGGADGANPYAGVILDSADNLYGTTYFGGAAGAGVVYELSPSGQEMVLHAFTGGSDGGSPYAGVVADAEGNLYGTTVVGGADHNGVVYQLDTAANFTVLHAFTGGSDGAYPQSELILDPAGNLYGTAQDGGTEDRGVVYRIDTAGDFTVLYAFTGGAAGGAPIGGVMLDAAGNLYGTTHAGVWGSPARAAA